MKRTLLILSLCLFGIAGSAYADVARPKPAPSPELPRIVLHTRLDVEVDTKAYEAKLQISQRDLQELRAALANLPDNGSTSRFAAASSSTIIAGIFMFLSLSYAGVWLARTSNSRGQKIVTALLLGSAVLGVAAVITQANAGPPGSYYWRKLPDNLSKGQPTYGGVDIEIVPDKDQYSGLKLIVPLKKY